MSPAGRAEQVAFELNADLPEKYQRAILEEENRAAKARAKISEADTRKVLLIGGAGYIGGVVARHLLFCGYHVRNLDLLLYGNEHSVIPHLTDPRYEFIKGDLAEPATLSAALDGVSDVVLLAGLVGDPITKKYPRESDAINEVGIQNVFRSLPGRGINKVIFSSTCSNYGLIEGEELATEDFELSPLSLYAKAKVRMEQELLSTDKDHHPTVLRFATAFGLSPRMRFDLTVNEFTREMALKRDLLVFDAETWRPYCHVNDFALAIRRVLEAPVELVRGEVFNVGGNENNFTKQMLVDEIRKRVPDAPVRFKEKGSDPRNYRVDFSRIRRTLHFEPEISVPQGIDEIVNAIRDGLFRSVEEQRNLYGNYSLSYFDTEGSEARD
jgi:nucleoside-diphosphate-sugar epimerase